MHRPFIKTGPNKLIIAIFYIATLLARNTTIETPPPLRLWDGDASNRTGRAFEEHDLRKTMHELSITELSIRLEILAPFKVAKSAKRVGLSTFCQATFDRNKIISNKNPAYVIIKWQVSVNKWFSPVHSIYITIWNIVLFFPSTIQKSHTSIWIWNDAP